MRQRMYLYLRAYLTANVVQNMNHDLLYLIQDKVEILSLQQLLLKPNIYLKKI